MRLEFEETLDKLLASNCLNEWSTGELRKVLGRLLGEQGGQHTEVLKVRATFAFRQVDNNDSCRMEATQANLNKDLLGGSYMPVNDMRSRNV